MEKKLIDWEQEDENLKTPEIRVWVHPHIIGESGDDYYRIFDSADGLEKQFENAKEFSRSTEEAEAPVIAFNGYEYAPQAFAKEQGGVRTI